MTTQNPWEAAKAVLRGKFIPMKSYLEKPVKHGVRNLKKLEKEQQQNPKVVEGKKS